VGAATIGFVTRPLAWWERVWAFSAAALLIVAMPVTDEAGFAACLGFAVWLWWRGRRVATA